MAIRWSRNLILFSALVAVQGAMGYYLNARAEYVPQALPLAEVPKAAGNWQMVREWKVEPEVQEVLRADDTLSRHYAGGETPGGAGLFIAYFRSQRSGVAPHSPKNCLPGNGWVSERSNIVPIDIPGAAPVEANLYVVQRGDSKSVVVYWYQSHGRTVADEYKAKFYVMADAIRLNRTDTALVRVTVPVANGNVEQAERAALDFVRTMYPRIATVLPA